MNHLVISLMVALGFAAALAWAGAGDYVTATMDFRLHLEIAAIDLRTSGSEFYIGLHFPGFSGASTWNLDAPGIDAQYMNSPKLDPHASLMVHLHAALAILLFLSYPSIVVLCRILRHNSSDYPACRSCGYNLTGNTSGVCPECAGKVEGP